MRQRVKTSPKMWPTMVYKLWYFLIYKFIGFILLEELNSPQ